MQINILAGGPTDQSVFDALKQNTNWIGIDRGNLLLSQNNIEPMVAIGDFDSMDQNEQQKALLNIPSEKIIKVKSEKDETDTELALETASKIDVVSKIDVYGALGKRLDHELSNLFILNQQKFNNIRSITRFINEDNIISFFNVGRHVLRQENESYKYVGLMPIGADNSFSITKAKYLLNNWQQSHIKMFSSNEFIDGEIGFEINTGILMVIQSKD